MGMQIAECGEDVMKRLEENIKIACREGVVSCVAIMISNDGEIYANAAVNTKTVQMIGGLEAIKRDLLNTVK